MNNPDSHIFSSIEDKLAEKVTVKLYDVAYGMADYCLLTGEKSGRKFTAMFSEKPMQIFLQENKTENYTQKERFLVEKENIRTLSERQIPVPAILFAGDNFIIMPYLGENLAMDNSLIAASSRLDEAVSGIIDCLAVIHSLPINTIPYRASCSRGNLEFAKNYSFLNIIENSDYAIAKNIRNAENYGRLCELIGKFTPISVGDVIIKGETYNPETVFCDGSKLHLTDYKFTGIGNPFFDIAHPVSWGLPSDLDEAVSKKQQRVRRYLSARKINDQQDVFFKLDYFTILQSINMMDVILDRNDKKTKILFKMAHRNLESLISGNPDLNEARIILLSLIPAFENK
ncbi:MAG: hypothetical protein WCE45_09005 [Sedimentisphaerales bacterium]